MKYKKVIIGVTTPIEYVDKIRNTICLNKGGIIGNYSYCSICYPVLGTFKPNKKANPYIGKCNNLEKVEEVKLEIVCHKNDVKKIIKKIKKVHPYEEPCITIMPLLDEKYF